MGSWPFCSSARWSKPLEEEQSQGLVPPLLFLRVICYSQVRSSAAPASSRVLVKLFVICAVLFGIQVSLCEGFLHYQQKLPAINTCFKNLHRFVKSRVVTLEILTVVCIKHHFLVFPFKGHEVSGPIIPINSLIYLWTSEDLRTLLRRSILVLSWYFQAKNS